VKITVRMVYNPYSPELSSSCFGDKDDEDGVLRLTTHNSGLKNYEYTEMEVEGENIESWRGSESPYWINYFKDKNFEPNMYTCTLAGLAAGYKTVNLTKRGLLKYLLRTVLQITRISNYIMVLLIGERSELAELAHLLDF